MVTLKRSKGINFFLRTLNSLGLMISLGGVLSFAAQERQDLEPPLPRVTTQQESSTPESASVPTEQSPTADYVIGPEDMLKIDVFEIPELSNLAVRVANDGTIRVPLLGHVEAAGLTPKELGTTLQSLWGRNYLQDPQVSVLVTEFHAKPVSIVGAVEKPGLYYLTGPRTLIEMLSMAGGLAKRSSAPAGRTVYVTRGGGLEGLLPTDGMRLVAADKVEIDLRKLFYSNDNALNISIRPLDIISVSKADVVYVTGRGVERPGGFVLEDRDNVTVLQALALAQGLSVNAKKHDAQIIRTQADGSRTEIPVDLDKVLKGKSADPVLMANDILIVPDSAQKAGLKRGVEAAIGTISGLLIYRR